MKLFDIATGREIKKFVLNEGGGQIPSVEFDATGKTIVASGPGATFNAIKIATGEVTVINESIGWIAEYRFSPDGRYMATGGASGITVWNAKTWKEIRRIGGGELMGGGRAGYVAFSRDSRFVACIDNEGRLHFWDPGTGADIHTTGEGLEPNGPLEFMQDGRVMALGADGKMKIFGPQGIRK